MKQKVVIIGHSYTSRLSLIRSVAQVGCDVTIIVMTGYKRWSKRLNTQKPLDCYSKYVSRVFYCLRKDKDVLIKLLMDYCTDPLQKVVIIPDSDDTVVAIDNNQELLKRHFVFPHINNQAGSIEYWMDKSHQKRLALELGLNVAEGRIVEINDGHYSIPLDIGYPCYSKPLATMNGGKGGMRKCTNKEELTQALEFIIHHRSPTIKVLVEDYKEIHQEYALLGFSDGMNVCIPGILKLLAISEQNKGIARQGMVMPVGNLQGLVDKFKSYVLQIGFTGIFDIDFYESDGVYYFCEINLRFGGSGYAITKMGVNLPAMMVHHLAGGPLPNMQDEIIGTAIYANERMCLDDYYNNYISLAEYKSILSNSDIRFVQDSEDPLPEKKYRQEFKTRVIKKAIKRLLNI